MTQMQIPGTKELVAVEKAATCNRCGKDDAAWIQGRKSGKWYLAQVVPIGDDGILYASRFDFHKCEAHDLAAYKAAQDAPKTLKPTTKVNPFLAIPKGRYALYDALQDRIDFFQVDQPDEKNRWYGWTFVKKLLGCPGDYRKVPLRGSQAAFVLKELSTDPLAAMVLYGLESGVCGNCASPLSDPESLARGLGPICAGNLGMLKKVTV